MGKLPIPPLSIAMWADITRGYHRQWNPRSPPMSLACSSPTRRRPIRGNAPARPELMRIGDAVERCPMVSIMFLKQLGPSELHSFRKNKTNTVEIYTSTFEKCLKTWEMHMMLEENRSPNGWTMVDFNMSKANNLSESSYGQLQIEHVADRFTQESRHSKPHPMNRTFQRKIDGPYMDYI